MRLATASGESAPRARDEGHSVQRVALSTSRLVAVTGEAVTFTSKDYRRGGQQKALTLLGAEFARRLVQPVLPRGLVRVRHDGLLANRDRAARLAQARALLGRAALAAVAGVAVAPAEAAAGCCPVCGSTRLERRRLSPAEAVVAGSGAGVAGADTS